MSKIKVTQVRSTIGRSQGQKDTLRALGIRRMHHSVVIDPNPVLMGMVKKISHLVSIEEEK